MVEKKFKKNQRCEESQTEFKQCEECSLDQELYRLTLKTGRRRRRRRRIVEEDGVRIDVDTGEVLGMTVETSYI